MSEHQASQAARRSALSGPSSNTRSRSMSQLSEGILGQHEEEAEDFITPLENLEKEKQPENRAEAIANKISDKGLDFFHHPAVIEMSEENRLAFLKVGDLRDLKESSETSWKEKNGIDFCQPLLKMIRLFSLKTLQFKRRP